MTGADKQKNATLAKLGVNLQVAAMMIDNMFHNRQPQTSSALYARSVLIDPVKTLGQARQMGFINPFSIIADLYTAKCLMRGRRVACFFLQRD